MVPGWLVTMARWYSSRAFIKEDLPVLGRPHSAATAPLRTSLALVGSPARCSALYTWRMSRSSWSRAACSSTSSGKSLPASMRESMSNMPLAASSTSWETPPLICRTAARAAAWPLAPTKAITASAWLKSIRPFSKARRVNSPGSARRAPASNTRRSTRWAFTSPPWH